MQSCRCFENNAGLPLSKRSGIGHGLGVGSFSVPQPACLKLQRVSDDSPHVSAWGQFYPQRFLRQDGGGDLFTSAQPVLVLVVFSRQSSPMQYLLLPTVVTMC